MEKTINVVSHLLAATIALSYAWLMSQTGYVTTALQFVTPLLLIILVHIGSLALSGRLQVGFAQQVFGRSASTAIGMVVVFFLASIAAPKPAMAATDVIGIFLSTVFCLLILLIVVVIASTIIIAIFRMVRGLWRWLRKGSGDGPETRLFDFASIGIAMATLAALSLEGLPNFYAYETDNRVVATQLINADPDHVWATMEQATSPEFPLPNILDLFPRPIAVVVDEGTALGANRHVQFQGREGGGLLSLQVTARDDTHATFSVLSDTSPYANWIGFHTLTYRVIAEGDQTRLEVSLGFQRRLAPSWFFTPMMKGAGSLAMGVLARDVKARAELPYE